MAKRFTDTEKWKNPNFRDMDPGYRWLWLYLLDTCDAAGIWRVDFSMASFCLGFKINAREAQEYFEDKVIVIDHDKWFIPSFIEFQYGELSEASKPHLSVIKILRKHGIDPKNLTLLKGYPKGIQTLKEKEQDQEKDKDKEKGPEFIFKTWNENRGPFSEAEKLTDKRKGNARAQLLKNPDIEHWLEILNRWKKSDFCLVKWKPTFDDWLNENKRIATLEGKYDNRGSAPTTAPNKTKYADMARDVWSAIERPGEIVLEPSLEKLIKTIGADKLYSLHRDEFRPSGSVPAMLKAAAEGAA